jgi:L,D-peptidoglycan transpeptidase YkuD (ErfK/YbiS/YcfS/YnhG family)
VRRVLLAACVPVCLAAASAGRTATPGCDATVANQLASTGSATQLVTVVAPRARSRRAAVELWQRSEECWTHVDGPWPALIGRHGVAEIRHEGDGTTPAGMFGFGRVMYGLAPNPGVHYRYRRIVCGDWWVEDPASRWYNRLRHLPCGARPPFKAKGGDLSRSPTASRYFAFIRYNVDPVVPGRGSAIFLHASKGQPTSGCVSIALPRLLRTLRWLRPSAQPVIVLGTRTGIARF